MTSVCVYAQTFPVDPTTGKLSCTDLENLISSVGPRKLIVYIASLHFGTDSSGHKYLHLNDTNVAELGYFFSNLETIYTKYRSYCEIRVMLGGAGGAYAALFSSFDDYYALLRSFLMCNPFLAGIDLDIEESLDTDAAAALDKATKLITTLSEDRDLAPLAITMAPVAYSLIGGGTGMGGFSYRDLESSAAGKMVTAYNVQSYGCFAWQTFASIIGNGFPADKLVLGMLGNEFELSTPLATAMTELQKTYTAYPSLAGVVIWELGDTKIATYEWIREVMRAMRCWNFDNQTRRGSLQ